MPRTLWFLARAKAHSAEALASWQHVSKASAKASDQKNGQRSTEPRPAGLGIKASRWFPVQSDTRNVELVARSWGFFHLFCPRWLLPFRHLPFGLTCQAATCKPGVKDSG
jgi:hypothetical protein